MLHEHGFHRYVSFSVMADINGALESKYLRLTTAQVMVTAIAPGECFL